jgi:hypothetical protein
MSTFAKVLTFHLPSEQVGSLLEFLDANLGPQYVEHPGFRGLLCLELSEGPSRIQVFVVSIWDDASRPEGDDVTDRLWDEASDALGVGIARNTCKVLRAIPGLPSR